MSKNRFTTGEDASKEPPPPKSHRTKTAVFLVVCAALTVGMERLIDYLLHERWDGERLDVLQFLVIFWVWTWLVAGVLGVFFAFLVLMGPPPEETA